MFRNDPWFQLLIDVKFWVQKHMKKHGGFDCSGHHAWWIYFNFVLPASQSVVV